MSEGEKVRGEFAGRRPVGQRPAHQRRRREEPDRLLRLGSLVHNLLSLRGCRSGLCFPCSILPLGLRHDARKPLWKEVVPRKPLRHIDHLPSIPDLGNVLHGR